MQKTADLSPLFRNLGVLWYNFWVNFRSLEALWERWGPILVSKNGLGHQRCPRMRHPQIPLTFWDPIGIHFLNIFRFCGVCFQASFFVELQGPFFIDLGDVPTSFFYIFLHLSAPLFLVFFCNPSIRKLVFQRYIGINFNRFCACFFDFISSVVFDKIFSTFGGIWGFVLIPKIA